MKIHTLVPSSPQRELWLRGHQAGEKLGALAQRMGLPVELLHGVGYGIVEAVGSIAGHHLSCVVHYDENDKVVGACTELIPERGQ